MLGFDELDCLSASLSSLTASLGKFELISLMQPDMTCLIPPAILVDDILEKGKFS